MDLIICDTREKGNKKIWLTHEPMTSPLNINIHGHLHTKEESHRDGYKLNENNILIEAEKIYFIDELLESQV